MLYFITGSKNKFAEIKAVLPQVEQLVIDLPEIQEIDAHEIIKAKLTEALKHHDGEFIVEDTSLYFNSLNGLPGPLIKWFTKTIGNDGLANLVDKLGNNKATAKTIIGYADGKEGIHFFEGEVVGINTAIYSRSGGNMGIGFAIPVSTARQVLEGIVRDGQVVRGWVGIEPMELTPELAETFGLKQTEGVIITGVLQNGPAANAGLRPGDMLLKVAGQPVKNVGELLTQIAALTPGQSVKLDVVRRNQSLTLDVTPAQRPKPKIQK